METRTVPAPEVSTLTDASAEKTGRVLLRNHWRALLAPRNCLNQRWLVTGSASFPYFNSWPGWRSRKNNVS
eukprot:11177731-Lingulodinium_polyedra.AAC.1